MYKISSVTVESERYLSLTGCNVSVLIGVLTPVNCSVATIVCLFVRIGGVAVCVL